MIKSVLLLGSILLVLTLSGIQGFAQTKYPALTRGITFEELQERSKSVEVEWSNPDGTTEKLSFVEMQIPVDEIMQQKTLNFVLDNYGLNSVWLDPRIIVFHSMGDGDLKSSLEISSFMNDEIPKTWGNLYKAGPLPNGAHFIIESNGRVICLTPPMSLDGSRISYERGNHKWIIKRHQDANPVALGIENVTTLGNFTKLTAAQLESNARLARWLIWLEDGRLEYFTSHHQFDDERFYDTFLKKFGLTHKLRVYRTVGRKDIGMSNLNEIVRKVNQNGIGIKKFGE